MRRPVNAMPKLQNPCSQCTGMVAWRVYAILRRNGRGVDGPKNGHWAARSIGEPALEGLAVRRVLPQSRYTGGNSGSRRCAKNVSARLLMSAGDGRASFIFLLAQFRRQRFAKVFGLENRTDLNFRFLIVRVGATLHPVDRFLQRIDFPKPETRNQLFRLRERSVYHVALLSREPYARRLRSRLQPLARQHDAGLYKLFIEFSHRGQQLRARHDSGFGSLGCFNKNHDFHLYLLSMCAGAILPGSALMTIKKREGRHRGATERNG